MLGKLLGPFMPYILGISIGAVAILAGLLWWSNSKYDKLVSEAATKIERAQANAKQFEQTTIDQKATITNLLISQAEDQVRTEYRNEQLALSQKSLDEERQKNDSYKARWAKVSAKKPGLLSRVINRATNKRVQFIASATCRAGCDKDGDTDKGSKTTTETSTGNGN